jgi:hypothetical protein
MIIVRLLSPEPFGWLAPPKSTRASEPTLLWNQFDGELEAVGYHAHVEIRTIRYAGTDGRFTTFLGDEAAYANAEM